MAIRMPARSPEEAALRPVSVYAATKVGAEALLRAYSLERGLEGIALRIGHVYGPGRRTACHIRTLVEHALAGRPTVIADGGRARRSTKTLGCPSAPSGPGLLFVVAKPPRDFDSRRGPWRAGWETLAGRSWTHPDGGTGRPRQSRA
jgi:hypothetical protein